MYTCIILYIYICITLKTYKIKITRKMYKDKQKKHLQGAHAHL